MSVSFSDQVSYSQHDFIYCLADIDDNGKSSRFDTLLDTRWRTAMDRGLFRFELTDDIATVCLPGKFGLYLQANSSRHKTRRRPPTFTSTRQPFDTRCFNFCCIPAHERLFRVTSVTDHNARLEADWLSQTPGDQLQQPISDGDAVVTGDDWLLINVSPIGISHSLLVPGMDLVRPQQLKTDGLARLIDLLLLSNGRSLRGIYNSLGALASVNHFHLHLYRFYRRLYLETAEAEYLSDRVMCVRDYPAPAVLFIVDRQSYVTAASDICRFTDLLLDMGLAFNMFITRGTDPRTSSDQVRPENVSSDARTCPEHDGEATSGDSNLTTSSPLRAIYSVLRVYVWARQPDWDQDHVTIASCELAGLFTLHDDSLPHTESEASLAAQMRRVTEASFERVRSELFAR